MLISRDFRFLCKQKSKNCKVMLDLVCEKFICDFHAFSLYWLVQILQHFCAIFKMPLDFCPFRNQMLVFPQIQGKFFRLIIRDV